MAEGSAVRMNPTFCELFIVAGPYSVADALGKPVAVSVKSFVTPMKNATTGLFISKALETICSASSKTMQTLPSGQTVSVGTDIFAPTTVALLTKGSVIGFGGVGAATEVGLTNLRLGPTDQ